jgi:hypothetical protein
MPVCNFLIKVNVLRNASVQIYNKKKKESDELLARSAASPLASKNFAFYFL